MSQPAREATRETRSLLARIVAEDFLLRRGALNAGKAERAATFLRSFRVPLVYTAFDGDQLGLTDLMRRSVIGSGRVPVDPEAILGYKDVVDTHGRKVGVLDDDLSLLRSCDELWLFTDLDAEPQSLHHLAEGALVELLFFLRIRPGGVINFVSTSKLLESTQPVCQRYHFDLETSVDALLADQVGGVAPFLIETYETQLRPVHIFIMDPLDTKYARWLRTWAYGQRLVPLVPQLAVRPGDTDVRRDHPLDCLLVSWALLQRLAERASVLPPSVAARGISTVSTVLAQVLSDSATKVFDDPTWDTIGIPKFELGPDWPLTEREKREFRTHAPPLLG